MAGAFLPPLGIEDNAKFRTAFALKISVGLYLQDDIFIYYMAEIRKKL